MLLAQFQLLIDHTRDIILFIRTNGQIVGANNAALQAYGYQLEELVSMNLCELRYCDPPSLVKKQLKQANHEGILFETTHRQKDGTPFPVEVSSKGTNIGKNSVIISIVRDISKRKQDEAALRNSEQRLSDLINFLPDATFAIDLDGKIITWNHAIEKLTAIKAQDMLGKNDYEYSLPFYETRRPMLIDFVLNPEDELKKKYSYLLRDREDIIAETFIPRFKGRETHLWAKATPLYDSEGRVTGAIESIKDITMLKDTEKALKESMNNLRHTLEGTVNALATIAEKRDPYTAGHQKRVSRLALAIAREIGLSEERTEAVRVAALLHDIGKIFVPADILNKPGQLTNIEKLIINTHPQVGCEIIKTIPFTNLAQQIVLQHHERLNGSGYPLGLTANSILLEAKILSVADVVEAMSSHRPYRPALGIDKALEEITRYKGVLYDSTVRNICIRVIQNQGFRLEE